PLPPDLYAAARRRGLALDAGRPRRFAVVPDDAPDPSVAARRVAARCRPGLAPPSPCSRLGPRPKTGPMMKLLGRVPRPSLSEEDFESFEPSPRRACHPEEEPVGSARRLASRMAGPWAPLVGSLRAGQATKDLSSFSSYARSYRSEERRVGKEAKERREPGVENTNRRLINDVN